MTLRRLIVAGSFAVGFLVGALAAPIPASAQKDERFSGRWEPNKKGGHILYVDPVGSGGFLSSLGTNGRYEIEQYEVIRDFGDHVVIKVWWLADELHANLPPALAILDLRDVQPRISNEWRGLRYYDCTGEPSDGYFFKDDDPESVWPRIQEWSSRVEEGFPYNTCNISPSGEPHRDQWSHMNWSRRND